MAAKYAFSQNFAFRYVALLGKPYHFIREINIRYFCTVQDKNFEYFRNNAGYKASAVQLSNGLDKSKIAGPGFSFFLKEHDIKSETFSHLSLRENVMRLSVDQVKDILCFMANATKESSDYSNVLKYLDEKCALSAGRWPLDLSLYIMDAWFIILGKKAFRQHYYSAVTSLWSRKVNYCTKNNIVQMLYFIGMSKTPAPFLMENLEDKMENFLDNFSDEEWAIALISFFKTSKKINSSLLLSKSCQVAENLLLQDNRFHLISILKCLRHARFYDERLWTLLKDYVKKYHKSFNFVESTNFLAAFAAQSVYDEDVFNCLESHCMELLVLEKQEYYASSKKIDSTLHPSVKSRVKDYARFLWSFTSLGHDFEKESLSKICSFLMALINKNEFEMQPHILVDCVQSLALVDCYSHDILNALLETSFYESIMYLRKDKPKYQLYFIQKCILLECPELEMTSKMLTHLKNAFNPIPKSLQKEIFERKGFQEIIDILRQNVDSRFCSFKCCYIVPHIVIAGIVVNVRHEGLDKTADKTVNFDKLADDNNISRNTIEWVKSTDSNGKYICIEILDSSVCRRNSPEPLGLIKTKIRQLMKMSFNVVTLTSDEINDIMKMTKSEQCKRIASLLK